MQDDKKLSFKEKTQAQIAGIWADRPGLLGEYPKMLYSPGLSEHNHLGQPIKVQGKFEVGTIIVHSADEEAAAIAEGWSTTPDMQADQERRDREQGLADENAQLRAQLAAMQERSHELIPSTTPSGEAVVMKRGPGRPPKVQSDHDQVEA